MIRDAAGNELTYWPVTGLRAGENSAVLHIFVDTPQVARLKATLGPNLTAWGRVAGLGGPWTNLRTVGLDLSVLGGPETEFEVYVSASAEVVTTDRVALTIGAVTSSPAGWVS